MSKLFFVSAGDIRPVLRVLAGPVFPVGQVVVVPAAQFSPIQGDAVPNVGVAIQV